MNEITLWLFQKNGTLDIVSHRSPLYKAPVNGQLIVNACIQSGVAGIFAKCCEGTVWPWRKPKVVIGMIGEARIVAKYACQRHCK